MALKMSLNDEAFRIAVMYARMNGTVTAPIVLEILKGLPDLSDELEAVDPRFLGGIFRRTGWTKVGVVNQGSHGREVPIWKWDGE